MDDEPYWVTLLKYGSHGLRHTGFSRLTVVNRTPGFWGVTGDLQEWVFMTQPEGFVSATKPHHLCKLRKALYGLKQAPRAWFEILKSAPLSWGFHNSISDTSLFYTHKQGQMLLLLVYVDDILINGESQDDVQEVITDLHQQFALKTLGLVNYFLALR